MKNHPLLIATLIVIVVFATASFAQLTIAAATTIGTDISTTGNLTV